MGVGSTYLYRKLTEIAEQRVMMGHTPLIFVKNSKNKKVIQN